MENIRRQLAANNALYSKDVITPGSSKPAAPKLPMNPGRPRNVIAISSDSDDDAPPVKKTAAPVKIPTNKDIPRPTKPAAPLVEAEDEDGSTVINIEAQIDGKDAWDFKPASEVDKELQELFSGTTVDHTIEIQEEDTIVPGFGPDFRLLHHQVQARRWMKEREENSKHGGILADDMGLGKTIQTLVRIVEGKPRKSDKEKGFAASTLVVAPTSLATQWEEEIKRMTSLKVILHTGASRTNDPDVLMRHHIVITTYGTVASEHNSASKKKVKDALFNVRWWRIVLDEAHTIKNRATKNAKACFDLKANHRWCLTGTPIQNKVEEFYSLINFLRVKPLNDWAQFKDKIVDPLKKGRSKAPMKRLHAVLKFIMLRRSKDDTVNGKTILDLPPKIIQVVKCDFSTDERRFYRTLEAKMAGELERLTKTEDNRSYMHMLTLLLRMRQACDHPALVTGDWKLDEDAVINQPENNTQDEEDQAANELVAALDTLNLGSKSECKICFKRLENSTDIYCEVCHKLSLKSIDTSASESAKIRKVVSLVEEVEERSEQTEKIIIFSQFTTMLRLVAEVLGDKGIKFVQYDGSMNQKQRAKVVDTIKEDPEIRVILMSFKAGGVGLNLTACNNIVLVDLWWNPALEDQAFGRAHRIGQKRQVNIWKLTIEDTVEDRILALQDTKRALADAALSGEALSKMATLGRDELLALFKRSDRDDEDEEDED